MEAMMREFMHGWRRKAGCATLCLSLFFAIGWLRSYILLESVSFDFCGMRHVFQPIVGSVITTHSTARIDRPPSWRSIWLTASDRQRWIARLPDLDPIPQAVHWEFAGFHLVRRIQLQYKRICIAIPFWSIVLPLTLLSGYLLIWKSRVRETVPPQVRKAGSGEEGK